MSAAGVRADIRPTFPGQSLASFTFPSRLLRQRVFSLGSILVARVQPLGEAQAGGPILAALREIAPIRELAVRVVAGLLAGDRIVALARGERRDLALTRHLQEMMVDDALGDAAAAHQHPVVAQD